MELDIVSQLCTQEGAAEQFRAFQQYQQSVGGGAAATTPISDYTMDNSTGTLRHRVRIASVAMQVPVLSSATKLGGELVDLCLQSVQPQRSLRRRAALRGSGREPAGVCVCVCVGCGVGWAGGWGV